MKKKNDYRAFNLKRDSLSKQKERFFFYNKMALSIMKIKQSISIWYELLHDTAILTLLHVLKTKRSVPFSAIEMHCSDYWLTFTELLVPSHNHIEILAHL